VESAGVVIEMNLSELPSFFLVAGAVLVGLYLSNVLYDYGVPQYISRKVGHGVGGMAYLLCVFLFSSPWYPVLLSGGFVVLLGGARFLRPSSFRGVGGTGRQHALAEVWFPIAGTLSLLIGWAWLGDPWLAVVPILFMAWGDMVTGLIRARVYGKEVKGNYGSLGMILVCLLVGALFAPYWISAVGAVVATLSEKFTPMSKGIWDDNWSIIVSSLLVMSLSVAYGGV